MNRALLLAFLFLQVTLVLANPSGLITWFQGSSCPAGWSTYGTSFGRLLLSVDTPSQSGVTVGSPLSPQSAPIHSHTYTTTLSLPVHDISAAGGGNSQGACNGNVQLTGTTSQEDSGVPFIQLILCRLNATDSGSVPFGTIAYFDPTVTACPSGWGNFAEADGRFLIGGYEASGAVVSKAPPISYGSDASQHDHNFNIVTTLNDVSYAGIGGCCDSALTNSGTYNVSTTSDEDSANIPYVQLLTCISQAETFNSSVPSDALLFNSIGCPTGWEPNLEVAGRFIVSAASGAVPGATFGGDSLPPLWNGPAGNHTHTFTSCFTPDSCAVALASGCCASGYAGDQQYCYSGITQVTDINLPYLSLPLCQQSASKKY